MDLWESVVRMASALGVVLALILALLAVLRSRLGQRFLSAEGSQLITVIGSGTIGPRKQIVLVAVAGEVLIIGTTATDMVSLGKIADPAQAAALLRRRNGDRMIPHVDPMAPMPNDREATHAG
jgi:flagellar biogenesis protein FliO